jgi:ribose transport system ATP-binding protein
MAATVSRTDHPSLVGGGGEKNLITRKTRLFSTTSRGGPAGPEPISSAGQGEHSTLGGRLGSSIESLPGPCAPWVSVRRLSKTFGSTTVLHGVDLDVLPGEVHGLVGQNGSGKSTLIKILSGVHSADAGASITVAAQPLSNPARPSELRRHGLAFVHQDLGLADEQSVTENVRVGQYRVSRIIRRIDWRAEAVATQATLDRLHASFQPSRLVSSLRPGEQAVVAIARALQNLRPGSGCVVFDESTQSLPREVLPEFYGTVRELARAGTAVVIVSHRLDEIMTLTDRVTVLQDGHVVAGGIATAGLSEAELARLVLGREIELERDLREARANPGSGTVRLRIRGLKSANLRGFDLEARGGEVVGITGSTHAGHDQIAYALGGALPDATGALTLDDQVLDLPVSGPHEVVQAGIALVPEQRLREGLAATLSAQENLTLPRVRAHGRAFLSSGWQDDEFARAVELLGIVPPNPHLPVASFSGGNQQKTMLAKWLLDNPRVLVLHEPTQGVDVGARMDILKALRAVAAGGSCVIVCSIEPQDLAFVCDRIVVMRDGRMTRELPAGVTAHDITAAIYE